MKFFGSEVNRIMVIQEQFGKSKNVVKIEDRLNEIEKERWVSSFPSEVYYNPSVSVNTQKLLSEVLQECKKVRLKYKLGSN